MEDLQDAIEDAHYINAMQTMVPKPTKDWPTPTAEEIEAYMAKLLHDNPSAFQAEFICNGSLGFYMFSKYLCEIGLVQVSGFIVDVALFRAKEFHNVNTAARKIVQDYLAPGSTGCYKRPEDRKSDTIRLIRRSSPQQSGKLGPSNDSPENGDDRNAGRQSTSDRRSRNRSRNSQGEVVDPDSDAAVYAAPTRANLAKLNQQSRLTPSLSMDRLSHVSSNHTDPEAAGDPSCVPAAGDDNANIDAADQDQDCGGDDNGNGNNIVAGTTGSTTRSPPRSRIVTPEPPAVGGRDASFANMSVVPRGGSSAGNGIMEPLELPRSRSTDYRETEYFHMENLSPPSPGRPTTNKVTATDSSVNAICVQGTLVNRVIALSAHSRTISLNLFDDLEEQVFKTVAQRHWEKFTSPTSKLWSKYLRLMTLSTRPVMEEDFPLFRVLGRGGFGMVSACKRAYSGKLFAVKVMSKHRVKLKKAQGLCVNERVILATVDSPYIVCLKYAFATPLDLYLVLDLMMGGDLSFHLRRRGIFTLNEAKYYAARMLLGLGALHDLNIVYRDLKPENILLDEFGHTKISDLGLAKRIPRNQEGVSGTCGTRGYWAPEMIRRPGGNRPVYNLSVDWFSFGCCVYEFLIGVSPFRTERAKNWGMHALQAMPPQLTDPTTPTAPATPTREQAIDLAIQQMEPDYMGLDECSRDLLQQLLIKDGATRLGARGGFREVIQHRWFRHIDFDNLNHVEPPIVPGRDLNMFSQSEIGGFADTKETRRVKLTPEDHKLYEHWQYTSHRAYQEEIVEFLLKEEVVGASIKPQIYSSSCCTIA